MKVALIGSSGFIGKHLVGVGRKRRERPRCRRLGI
jgi:putative NADH-flavin reductase